MNNPEWIFNESKSVGVDYFDQTLVNQYDKEHEKFRNFEKEAQKISSDLNLSKDSAILDIGCGTGGLSVHLSKLCKHVYAVDSSPAMLIILNKKIDEQKILNIYPIQSGLVSYKHTGEKLDAIIVNVCLHHLPDFWKQIALANFYSFLKEDGKLFICDVVFDFKPPEHTNIINNWIKAMHDAVGKQMADEIIIHMREEFSTWNWIMSGMIEKAGFNIDKNVEIMSNIRVYICSKK